MILILGGTTEGRVATRVVDEAGKPFYYSTRGNEQVVESKNGIRISGGLDKTEMEAFCRANDIRLLIDAAHPFASALHETVDATAQQLHLPVVRLERQYPALNSSCILCESYDDAVLRMKQDGISCLLALTGVQTIGKLAGYWRERTTYFRILEQERSKQLAEKAGFPAENLLYYDTETPIADIIQRYRAQAVITKESGKSGGFEEKQQACLAMGIPLYVVLRPTLPPHFITVTGEYGLRKEIEKHLPHFYPLRSGFTTGSCATVASKAALLTLLGRGYARIIPFQLPNGETLRMKVDRIEKGVGWAKATVTKDAGDDPDVIHGKEICAHVAFSTQKGIRFLQGEGVGRVTLPGIGLPIGEPAINRVPRQMITHELTQLYAGGLDVTVSVPQGKDLAPQTFNPKLGIEGGISILGTLGIVRPFSSEAFVESIEREIEVAVALGAPRLVINSGAKSEKFVKGRYPDLPSQCFIHYGNFIGETLRLAEKHRLPAVTLGIMLGKAVKLAEGHLDTHSKKATLNKVFLRTLATEAQCSVAALAHIDEITLARELKERFSTADAQAFFAMLLAHCRTHCEQVFTGHLTLLLIHENGEIVE